MAVTEVEAAGRLLHGIEHLYVTGGEPTLHPQLSTLAPRLREMFGCRRVTLATNGFRIRELGESLRLFDDIFISHYEDNLAEVEYAKRHLKDILAPGPTWHIPVGRRAVDPAPCFRAREGIAYAHGRLHPCCVVLGPEGGIPLTATWREAILEAPLPCANCCFAEEADSPAGLNVLHDLGDATVPWVEGVHADGWMGERMAVHIPRSLVGRGEPRLELLVLSYGPASIHPVRLEAQSGGISRAVLEAPAPGEYAWRIPLAAMPERSDGVEVAVESRVVFNPARLQGEAHNDRDISVMIASVRIGGAETGSGPVRS